MEVRAPAERQPVRGARYGHEPDLYGRVRVILMPACREGHILLPIGTTSDCIGCRTSDGAVANSRSCYTGFDSQHWIRVHNCDYAKNL